MSNAQPQAHKISEIWRTSGQSKLCLHAIYVTFWNWLQFVKSNHPPPPPMIKPRLSTPSPQTQLFHWLFLWHLITWDFSYLFDLETGVFQVSSSVDLYLSLWPPRTRGQILYWIQGLNLPKIAFLVQFTVDHLLTGLFCENWGLIYRYP